ncbi:MAG: hypothetical protein PHY43_11170 [Verrucomicrobiales bacterium]|nr:hypothetical protein [Verrucomicrobiales bacterium]
MLFILNCVVIALLDYGSSNLRSVHKSLLTVGADVRLVQHRTKKFAKIF